MVPRFGKRHALARWQVLPAITVLEGASRDQAVL